MKRTLSMLVLVLGWMASGCNSPAPAAEKSVPSAKTAKADKTAKDGKTAVAPVETAFSAATVDAEKAIQNKDYGGARQLIARTLGAIDPADKSLDVVQAELTLLLGNVDREESKEMDARRHYADAAAIFHVHKHANGRMRAAMELAVLEMDIGDTSAASRHLDEAKQLLAEVQDQALVARYHVTRGQLAARRMDHVSAIAATQEALAIYDKLKLKREKADATVFMAMEEDAADRAPSSRQYLNAAMAIYREIGDKKGEAQCLYRLAAIAERDRSWTVARQLLTKAAELYGEAGDQVLMRQIQRRLETIPES